jgi:hypothetical protein
MHHVPVYIRNDAGGPLSTSDKTDTLAAKLQTVGLSETAHASPTLAFTVTRASEREPEWRRRRRW